MCCIKVKFIGVFICVVCSCFTGAAQARAPSVWGGGTAYFDDTIKGSSRKTRHSTVSLSRVIMSLSLQHPFTAIVAGPTGCGKTHFVFRLVENASRMIEPSPREIWYCYGEFPPMFARYPRVKFHEGLLDMAEFDGQKTVLLIIDDLMSETNDTVANSPRGLTTEMSACCI